MADPQTRTLELLDEALHFVQQIARREMTDREDILGGAEGLSTSIRKYLIEAGYMAAPRKAEATSWASWIDDLCTLLGPLAAKQDELGQRAEGLGQSIPALRVALCLTPSDGRGVPVAYRYKFCGAGGTILSAKNPAKGEQNKFGIYENGVYDVEPLYTAAGAPGAITQRTVDALLVVANGYDELTHAAQRECVKRLFQMVRDDATPKQDDLAKGLYERAPGIEEVRTPWDDLPESTREFWRRQARRVKEAPHG
ncbi:MAG TPA: hypothetical protein VEA40_00575 [Ramlibacter sp.]|nr:hypothetical protein [Ramlibacter sp.]